MKKEFYPVKEVLSFLCLSFMLLHTRTLMGQHAVCNGPTTLFGLSNSGSVFPISSVNANVSAQLNPSYTQSGNYLPVASGSQSLMANGANAIGYNSVNGKFYYFKRSPGVSNSQFVSFDPVSGKYVILAKPATSESVYSASVTPNGLGYYCITNQAKLWYYNIYSDTWTLITGTIMDQDGANISTYIKNHPSGDMACDGYGNLWFMPSGLAVFGLFKLSVPLPTTAVSNINVTTVVPGTTPSPDASNLWGIAFDPLGNIFMAIAGDRLYKLATATSTPQFVGTFNGPISGVAADLTSCAFPMYVLPVNFIRTSAALQSDASVLVNWSVSEQDGIKGYNIEHSKDGVQWRSIGYVSVNTLNDSYLFTDFNPTELVNYYRIAAVSYNDARVYSSIKIIRLKRSERVTVWPNPAVDIINIRVEGGGTVQLFDLPGRVLVKTLVQTGINRLSLQGFPPATYLLQISLQNGERIDRKIIKR